jgi:hypothetical protein
VEKLKWLKSKGERREECKNAKGTRERKKKVRKTRKE